MNKIKRIAEIRELLMQDAEEQCICRTRGYLTANFYMEIGKKNYEVELIVDEDWQNLSDDVISGNLDMLYDAVYAKIEEEMKK